MTALKINIPDVSAEIAFNFSEILAAAITSDNVDVRKMLMQSLFSYQTNVE